MLKCETARDAGDNGNISTKRWRRWCIRGTGAATTCDTGCGGQSCHVANPWRETVRRDTVSSHALVIETQSRHMPVELRHRLATWTQSCYELRGWGW